MRVVRDLLKLCFAVGIPIGSDRATHLAKVQMEAAQLVSA